MATRQEVNLSRLINRCETMLAEKRPGNWRVEKYICALLNLFDELKKTPSCPSQEVLDVYARKIEFLRGLIQAEKLPTPSDKLLAIEKLSPASFANGAATVRKEHLHHISKERYKKLMRDELFGQDSSENNLRKRNVEENNDIDSILHYHHQMQEKYADEMLLLTRNLKDYVAAANKVVKDDVKTLAETTLLASTNYDKLRIETERVEAHTKTYSWWIWLMILLVTVTFLFMILFIRLFQKNQ